MTTPGIKWYLINNWEGAGFRSHTFAARVPGGALIKTTERFLAAVDLRREIGPGADDLEHITSALVFVPNLAVTTDDSTGEYATLERLEPRRRASLDSLVAAAGREPRPYRIELSEPEDATLDAKLTAEDFEPPPSKPWAWLGAFFHHIRTLHNHSLGVGKKKGKTVYPSDLL